MRWFPLVFTLSWIACGGDDGKPDSTDPTNPDATTGIDDDADGYELPLDCDDGDPDVHPEAVEVPYDGIDQDCDGGDLRDVDGDGSEGAAVGGDDCDDDDPDVAPTLPETYYDGIDNDCDPTTVDDDADADGDPFTSDCDDDDPLVYTGAAEEYYDGIDNDCDPTTADNDQDGDGDPIGTDCRDDDPTVSSDRPETYYDGVDNDCDPKTIDDDQDSDGDPVGTDCDDTDPDRSSLLVEIDLDGIDNDCDPTTPDVPFIDPVAVGFEFSGVALADGTLTDGMASGIPLPAFLTLRFADLDYFSTGDSRYTCEAIALFTPAPLTKPLQIPTHDGVAPFTSYDTNVAITFHTCAGLVDPQIWAPDASLLIDAFDGAHLGVGFAPQTTYLESFWDAQTLMDYGDSMIAMYIAINDANGDWLAFDWTTAFTWDVDPSTLEVAVDANGLLSGVDVSQVLPGADLPDIYVTSYAIWYQDFPLMDLSNLADPPN